MNRERSHRERRPPWGVVLLLVATTSMAGLTLLRSEGSSAAASADEPVGRLVLWHGFVGTEAQVLEREIERFERLYPSVDVLAFYHPTEEMPDRFAERARFGLAPDLVLAPNVTTRLLEATELMDLAGTALLDDLKPLALGTVDREGRTLGLPIAVETHVLYYRTDLLDEPAGDLNRLLEDARAGRTLAIPVNFFDAVWGVAAFGGAVRDLSGRIALNQGGFVRWLRWLLEVQAYPGVVLSPDRRELIELFAQGRAAYLVASIVDLPELRAALGDLVGITELPRGPVGPGRPYLVTEVLTLARRSSSAQATASLALAEFLSAPQQQRRMMLELERVPSSLLVGIDPSAHPATHTARLQSFETIPFRGDAVERSLLSAIGDDAYTRVLAGVVEPEEAAARLAALNADLLGFDIPPAPAYDLPSIVP